MVLFLMNVPFTFSFISFYVPKYTCWCPWSWNGSYNLWQEYRFLILDDLRKPFLPHHPWGDRQGSWPPAWSSAFCPTIGSYRPFRTPSTDGRNWTRPQWWPYRW